MKGKSRRSRNRLPVRSMGPIPTRPRSLPRSPPTYDPVTTLLLQKNVSVTNKPETSGGWVNMLVQASPFIVLIAFWIFMMRQMQSGGNKALSFGKSRARLHGFRTGAVPYLFTGTC